MSLRKESFKVRSRRTIPDDHNGYTGYVSKHGEIVHLLLMGQAPKETHNHFSLGSYSLAPCRPAMAWVESFAVNAARPIVQAGDPLLLKLRDGRMRRHECAIARAVNIADTTPRDAFGHPKPVMPRKTSDVCLKHRNHGNSERIRCPNHRRPEHKRARQMHYIGLKFGEHFAKPACAS
jgi:hypothetical protein